MNRVAVIHNLHSKKTSSNRTCMTATGRWSVTPHAVLTKSLRPDPLIRLLLMRMRRAHQFIETVISSWKVASAKLVWGVLHMSDKIDLSLLISRFRCAYGKSS
jgi:hypothetical protein